MPVLITLQEESAGKVVTLMANDAQKLQDAMMAIHAIWGAPAFVVAVLILLWFQASLSPLTCCGKRVANMKDRLVVQLSQAQ